MAAPIQSTGRAVDIMPVPRPAMMLVAAPVFEASAIFCAGRLVSAVKYSVSIPMAIPAASPPMVATKMPMAVISESAGTSHLQMGRVSAAITIPAVNVPTLSAFCGFPPSRVRTRNVPPTETTIPTAARTRGSTTRLISPAAAPSTMEPMMDPTYDSNRSAPMPATSPTLSPTLSAMVAGLRGSSSGMPASTLPTRSAPTSAALV